MSLKKHLKVIKELKIDVADFSILTPFPGYTFV